METSNKQKWAYAMLHCVAIVHITKKGRTYNDTDYPLPIKKSIYHKITTVLKAKNGVFRDTFSSGHKSLVLVVEMQVPTN